MLRDARDHASGRGAPTADLAKQWHVLAMEGLEAPDGHLIGRFRGEPGLEFVWVSVGPRDGVPPVEVADQLGQFLAKLATVLDVLDRQIPVGAIPGSADQLNAVLEVCGWAHAEWVRIHPFANGNGRTARLWANYVAMRYRLPPCIRLRPRPGAKYAAASAQAMEGNWLPTVEVIRNLYLEEVRKAR